MPFDVAGFGVDDRVHQIDDVIQLIGAPDKWVKGKRRTGDGRFCVAGALIELSATRLRPVILEAINEVTGKRYGSVEAFNDDVETSHSMLMRVLERARVGLSRATSDNQSKVDRPDAGPGSFSTSLLLANDRAEATHVSLLTPY